MLRVLYCGLKTMQKSSIDIFYNFKRLQNCYVPSLMLVHIRPQVRNSSFFANNGNSLEVRYEQLDPRTSQVGKADLHTRMFAQRSFFKSENLISLLGIEPSAEIVEWRERVKNYWRENTIIKLNSN